MASSAKDLEGGRRPSTPSAWRARGRARRGGSSRSWRRRGTASRRRRGWRGAWVRAAPGGSPAASRCRTSPSRCPRTSICRFVLVHEQEQHRDIV